MPRRVALLLVLPVFLLAFPAHGDELRTLLPVVNPPFWFSIGVIDFEIEVPIVQVSKVALRLKGNHTDHIFICPDDPYDFYFVPSRIAITLGDDVLASQEIQIIHSLPAIGQNRQSFTITKTIFSGELSGSPSLMDGTSQLGFADHAREFTREGDVCNQMNLFGEFTEILLIVTYDPSIPVEPTTWGSIKGLYR